MFLDEQWNISMRDKLRKEELREHNQRNWIKEGPHKSKKKYSRKDRRNNKYGNTEYPTSADNV